jgi:hypothetical protein
VQTLDDDLSVLRLYQHKESRKLSRIISEILQYSPAMSLVVSQHAVQRWQERVAPVPSSRARDDIVAFVLSGTATRKPRPWMRDAPRRAGDVYVYNHELPGVCAVKAVRALGALELVVTVYVRPAVADRRRLPPLQDRRWRQERSGPYPTR